MAYGWIIDVDHLADKEAPKGTNSNARGLLGPPNITKKIVAMLRNGKGRHFRIHDGDGELNYEGRWIGPGWLDGDLGEQAFGPLDDFGTPNAGATEIRYRNGKGEWKTL